MWDPFEDRPNNDKDDHDMETRRNTSLMNDSVDSSNATQRISSVEKVKYEFIIDADLGLA